MEIRVPFSKYHGLGNDFIVIDNRAGNIALLTNTRQRMCDRKYGIGADGILQLGKSQTSAFVLDYFNSDGKLGSLCGNGCRCALAFARKLKIYSNEIKFEAHDGIHSGCHVTEDIYSVSMKDVKLSDITQCDDNNYFLSTGSPHHVRFVENVSECDVIKEGRELRYGKYGDDDGANINFVEMKSNGDIMARTYERGIEDETLACGSGATGVAMVIALRQIKGGSHGNEYPASYDIHMGSGKLTIKFDFDKNKFKNVYLIGGATHVFDGVFYI